MTLNGRDIPDHVKQSREWRMNAVDLDETQRFYAETRALAQKPRQAPPEEEIEQDEHGHRWNLYAWRNGLRYWCVECCCDDGDKEANEPCRGWVQ